MTAQPHEPDRMPERIPKTADGVAGALAPARRMDFYRELGTAELGEVEAVLRKWWCWAMLDTDPDRQRAVRDADNGATGIPVEQAHPLLAALIEQERAGRE